MFDIGFTSDSVRTSDPMVLVKRNRGGEDTFGRMLDRPEPREAQRPSEPPRDSAAPERSKAAAPADRARSERQPSTKPAEPRVESEPAADAAADTPDTLETEDTAALEDAATNEDGTTTSREELVTKLTEAKTEDGEPLLTDPDDIEHLADLLLELQAANGSGATRSAEEILQEINALLGDRTLADGTELANLIAQSSDDPVGAVIAGLAEQDALLQRLLTGAGAGEPAAARGAAEAASAAATKGAAGPQQAAAEPNAKGTQAGAQHPNTATDDAAKAADARPASLFGSEPAADGDGEGDANLAKLFGHLAGKEGGSKAAASATAGANAQTSASALLSQTIGQAAAAPVAAAPAAMAMPDTPNNFILTPTGVSAAATAQQVVQTPQVAAQAATAASSAAVEIAKFARQGETRFEIRLDPPELGRVDVRLRVGDDGIVRAHLFVERSETLDMFMRDPRALERSLEQQGIKTAEGGLEFSLSSDNGSQTASQDGDGEPSFFGGDSMDEIDAAERPVATYTMRAAHNGRLDVRI
ncbi:flagellar hook-length control protein FliK [Rhodobium gokarnense]|uniref:Flagellar hook-length control protein FliK n=1 Tax=Rhodobium gokarnense TaxID=364296 RepID=A0ABT3H5K8_9HYPH|nr:flagellar hook-length control protein FliK [Rhodobium gokarnense]MCW2305692.1 flagellar hook-length control protein FliK [Rhodobium gokarnense]